MLEPTSAIGAALKTVGYAKTAGEFWGRLKPTLRSKIRVKVEKHFKSFSEYLDYTNNKASTVQLICSRAINSALDDVYIPCNFNVMGSGKSSVTDNDLISDIRDGKRVVVRGNGGSGKTLFMKRLWKSVYAEPNGKIPVFIELRKFNDMDGVDILTLIRHTLSPSTELSLELFRELALDGSFLLIFDGFDEVSIEKRTAVERQLLEFEQSFKKCSIVISSRPNETFIGWKAFHTFDIMPFTRPQILDLISKTPLDSTLISKFKNLITPKFFAKHEEFLCSPLLALMMLVTFKQKAEISDNLIDFYDNAFHALYSEHDAIKESYKRPHCLSINEFRLLFSTFCMFTYYQEKFELREAEIREFIQKSLDHVNLTRDTDSKINCGVEDFLHEVLDAVNLMRKEGLTYLFVHRSFQEFFAAYWVIIVDSKRTAKLLEDFAMRPGDNVLSLAYQMNNVKVDEFYILPFHQKMIDAGFIYKSKPDVNLRWPYLEGYDLSITWRLAQKKRNDQLIPIIYPSWNHGEVAYYYINLDKLVFQKKLQAKFIAAMNESFDMARPSRFVRDYAKDKRQGIRLNINVDQNKINLLIHEPDVDIPMDVSEVYLTQDTKYHAKLEKSLSRINDMLRDLNKTVNTHISKIKDGHTQSEKNLDDMFF